MDHSPCNLRLGIASQEDVGRAVGQEDGHRVVVGLGKEYAVPWSDDVRKRAAREQPSTICLNL
jgi:hypothetical protein